MKIEMWSVYDVTWTFVTKLCASVPANPKVRDAWIKAKMAKQRQPEGKTIQEIQEEVVSSLANREDLTEEDLELASLLVFQGLDGALVLRADTIRAHLKDCSRVLSYQYIEKLQGHKSLSVLVKNGVYLNPSQYWISILRPGGDLVVAADDRLERFVHSTNPKTGAPINAIKCFEWIQPACIKFQLQVLGGCVEQEDLETLMEYGGVHGYGGERSAGEGKYIFTLTKVKEATNAKILAEKQRKAAEAAREKAAAGQRAKSKV